MVKLGLVVFANDSGLGMQTKRLAQMLKPYRLLAIDSTSFSRNTKQNWEWYEGFDGYKVQGFPSNREIRRFLTGLTHVLVCENPLNFYLFEEAHRLGIKTYCQSNYEFCDNLNNRNLPVPDKFLMPSHWKVEEMKAIFGDSRVMHLPPPINTNEFKEARELNFKRDSVKSFVHIVGTLAVNDRNGTLDILRALQYAKGNFTITIKSQHELPSEYMVNDSRVRYKIGNEPEAVNLYKDFDAMILPRRYGGLCLSANEALMSGLPVIMSDISPNNQLLPKEWLVPSKKTSEFIARVVIDVHSCDPVELAGKIDWFAEGDLNRAKALAFDIGYTNFSDSALVSEYQKLW